MLTEVSLIDALTAFVKDQRVIILNADDLVAISLEEELKALKDPKVHFLVDVPAAAVEDPDQVPKARTTRATKKEAKTTEAKPKRKYTKRQSYVETGARTGSKPPFDAGKCQALIDANRDVHFLCVEFGLDEAELFAEMTKHGIRHTFAIPMRRA